MALIGERSTLLVLAIAIAAGVAVIATTKGVPIVIAARAITIGPRRLQRNQPLASRISVTHTAAASDSGPDQNKERTGGSISTSSGAPGGKS